MPFSNFPKEPITLIKKNDGTRIEGKAIVSNKGMTVFDPAFPVEAGDLVERALPSGIVERYEVVDPGFHQRFHSIPAHYQMKVRNAATPRSSAVVHNYNNSGQVGAMGPNAMAAGNSFSQQINQGWSEAERTRISAELAALRTELIAHIEGADDAIEVGAVGEAEKALSANDQAGVFAALKRLGRKTWDAVERLGLEWLRSEARARLGLPPGEEQ